MTTTQKARKLRGDSKLGKLPPAKHADLVDGMLSGWLYSQVADWLLAECGLTISDSGLTAFYQREVAPILKERKRFAALSAKTLGKMAAETEAFDTAAVAELTEYAYRLIRDPASNPEEARKWMETLIKAQASARDNRKLALLEAKASRLDALEAKAREIRAEGGLTPEVLEMLEKQLKLL